MRHSYTCAECSVQCACAMMILDSIIIRNSASHCHRGRLPRAKRNEKNNEKSGRGRGRGPGPYICIVGRLDSKMPQRRRQRGNYAIKLYRFFETYVHCTREYFSFQRRGCSAVSSFLNQTVLSYSYSVGYSSKSNNLKRIMKSNFFLFFFFFFFFFFFLFHPTPGPIQYTEYTDYITHNVQ